MSVFDGKRDGDDLHLGEVVVPVAWVPRVLEGLFVLSTPGREEEPVCIPREVEIASSNSAVVHDPEPSAHLVLRRNWQNGAWRLTLTRHGVREELAMEAVGALERQIVASVHAA